jgi:hypothetical protein
MAKYCGNFKISVDTNGFIMNARGGNSVSREHVSELISMSDRRRPWFHIICAVSVFSMLNASSLVDTSSYPQIILVFALPLSKL